MNAKTTLSLLAACLTSAAAVAQTTEKPTVATEIEAVSLQVQNDGENAYFHFANAVRLTGTNMLLECDSLEVFATREAEEKSAIGKFSAIKEIIAKGNVRIVQEERTATCELATVKPNEERIVLTGNPVVIQPGGRIVTYNPEDEIVLDRGNGRISIITKGPRKLRLTSSAIGDLGFENQGPIPTQGEQAPEADPTGTELKEEKNAETTTQPEPAPASEQ